jgi:phage gp36-like protein
MSSGKSASSKVTDKVQQVAQEDFNQAKALANDAVRSGAYLYPFKVCPAILIYNSAGIDTYRVLRTSSHTARFGVLSLRS